MHNSHTAYALLASALAIQLLAPGSHAPRLTVISRANPRMEAGLREEATFTGLFGDTSTASFSETLEELAAVGALEEPELTVFRGDGPLVCRGPGGHSAVEREHQG